MCMVCKNPDPNPPPGRYTDSLLTKYGRTQAYATTECTLMLEVGVRVVLPLSYAVEIEMLIFSHPVGRLGRERGCHGEGVKALRQQAPGAQ